MEITKTILYCIGLWLAEGDSTSKGELTFTNNSLELVFFFRETIGKVYSGSNEPRLYVYSATGVRYFENLTGFKRINHYRDTRANRPYYIYRLGDTAFLKKWKELVNEAITQEEYYADILTGIFAGEGNIKYNEKSSSRSIRISAKKVEGRKIIEKILKHLEIPIKYEPEHGSYSITARNLEKIYELEICKLHPEKSHQFLKMLQTKKEKHYSPGELKNLLLNDLDTFRTTKELSKKLGRSELRILEVLQELKREGTIGCIKKAGIFVWAHIEIKRDYIYQLKKSILSVLHEESYTQIGRQVGLSRKVIKKELEKLKTEGYLYRDLGNYEMTEKGKQLLLGVDEAGSF